MNIIKYSSVTIITLIIFAGILFPMVPHPQNWYELPLVPGLEEKARIIFFHVPTAWVTVFAFLISMYYGVRYLKSENIEYDFKSVASAGIGVIFCLIATITGSIWAKFNWGSFWNWDPRETSIFILLLIYSAYFALRSSINVVETRARLSAVYAIIAGLISPFFIFIMPRITSGLHPGAKGDEAGSLPVAQLSMPPNMLIVFIASIIGFTLLFIWLLNLRFRLYHIEKKIIRLMRCICTSF